MFWLALIGGSLVLLHVLVLLILKLRKKSSENQRGYGALTFPRFEILLIILALPCICEASATLVKGTLKCKISLIILQLPCILVTGHKKLFFSRYLELKIYLLSLLSWL